MAQERRFRSLVRSKSRHNFLTKYLEPSLGLAMEAEGCEGEGMEKKNPLQISDLQGIDNFLGVPRPGLEPGCLAALVFETSASTYSAIWASSLKAMQRYNVFSIRPNIMAYFF